jgi:aldehyde dehydrogenase (NAD+)
VLRGAKSQVTLASVYSEGLESLTVEVVPTGLFIDNEFVPALSGATIDIENPSAGTNLATVSAAQKEDVDRAVASAKKAFATWKTTTPATKRQLLNKLADLVERDAAELASLEALEGGVLYKDSIHLHIPQSVETLRYFAGWSDKVDGDSIKITQGLAYTRREPIGVCGAIVPWNTLMTAYWKLAPAIATGNVVVLKTPELTPLWGQKTAQLVAEAGFPPGVINIITGIGNIAGQALSEHKDVKKISFTGSPAVGRRILTAAAQSNLKKVTLELGGKGPSIIFDDADWDNALFWATAGITIHNGQVCVAGSRIYVQDTIYDKFLEEFSKRSSSAVHGDPLLPETTKAGVASKTQLERILSYVEKGKASGARLLHGGEKLPGEGHFVANTAFADVEQNTEVMQEEIFGPVASIARFTTEEEVIAKANDSSYGLNASVFTNDINKAYRLSEAIESGTVTINAWATINANTSFGGVKESGFGRDLGKEALDNWTVSKTVKWNILAAKK